MAQDRNDPSEQIPETDLLEQQAPLDPPLTQRIFDHRSTPGPPVDLIGSCSDDPFSVSFRRARTRSVVTVTGELDAATAPQLDGLLRCVCSSIDGDLEIDAAAMTFCDCAGLSVLLQAAARRRERGQRLTISHAASAVRQLIVLTGTATALPITDQPAATADGRAALSADPNEWVPGEQSDVAAVPAQLQRRQP